MLRTGRDDGDAVPVEFMTTLHYPKRPNWVSRSLCLTEDGPSMPVRAWRLLTRARPGIPLVIDGFSAVDRLTGIVLARLRRVPIVVSDSTWSSGTGILDRLATRIGVRLLAGPRTVFCVLSEAERSLWPSVWGVPVEQLAAFPWHHGVDTPAPNVPPTGDGTVFSGGHAQRDYRPVLQAIAKTDAKAWIATDPADLPADLPTPDSATVGKIPREDFHQRLANASLVIVSLADGLHRTAGQTTYLDAMALGGLVAVSDTIGVREHITHRETGLIFFPGDSDGLAELICWATDPANEVEIRKIRAAAIERARCHFSPEVWVDGLLAAVEASRGLVPKTRS